jgi:hypothetical protein
MFDLLGVYFAIRVTRSDGSKLRDAVFAGISIAAALTTDYVNVILIPIIMGYLILSLRGRRRSLARLSVGFLLVSFIGILLVGLYNEAIFGTAFHTTEQVYLNSSTPFGEFSNPIYMGIYLNLFSPLRGLFVFSIFLILGIFGFVGMLKQPRCRKEALLLLACFLGIFLPYSAWYDPTGGAAFGPRFLVSAIPFLLMPAGLVIESGSNRVRVLAFHLYAVGVVINGIAGITSALAPTDNYGLSPFLNWTFPSFLNGGIDVWWLSFVGQYWAIPALLVISLAVALPLMSDHFLSRGDEQTESESKSPPTPKEADAV